MYFANGQRCVIGIPDTDRYNWELKSDGTLVHHRDGKWVPKRRPRTYVADVVR